MSSVWLRLVQSARLMVGVGDYQRYCEHRRQCHPGEPVMTEAEFFRYCQDRRYASKGGDVRRCPC